MRPETANWLSDSDYDFNTAKDLMVAGRYVYTVFFLHLAVEKALKAILIESNGLNPPRIHDLVRLSQLAGLSLTAEQEDFLSDLTEAQTGTRYRRQSVPTISRFPAQLTQWYVDRCAEVLEWLRRDPRLRP